MKNKPSKLKGVAEFVIARVRRLQTLSGIESRHMTSVYIQQAFDEWEAMTDTQRAHMELESEERNKSQRGIVSVEIKKNEKFYDRWRPSK